MPKARRKLDPGKNLAKIIRRRKKPLKKKARIKARSWRMRAKALLREKRVEWTEFLEKRFEKSLLKRQKRPLEAKMFYDRAIPRIEKEIGGMQEQLKRSFNETAKLDKLLLSKLRALQTKSEEVNHLKLGLPPVDKPRHLWTKAEETSYSNLAKKIKGYSTLAKKIKEQHVIENKIRGLKGEIQWINDLKKSAL